jgi:hypothetical protein
MFMGSRVLQQNVNHAIIFSAAPVVASHLTARIVAMYFGNK